MSQSHRVTIYIDAKFSLDTMEAKITDMSFVDLPSLIDADELINRYKKFMTRFKDYNRVMITVESGFYNYSRLDKYYFSARTIQDHGKVVRADFNGANYDDWHDSDHKTVIQDIREAVLKANTAQIRITA